MCPMAWWRERWQGPEPWDETSGWGRMLGSVDTIPLYPRPPTPQFCLSDADFQDTCGKSKEEFTAWPSGGSSARSSSAASLEPPGLAPTRTTQAPG